MRSPAPQAGFFDVTKLKKQVLELEKNTLNPDFWKDKKNAYKISEELNEKKETVKFWEDLWAKTEKLKEKSEITNVLACSAKTPKDKEECQKIEKEILSELEKLQTEFKKEKIKTLFSEKFDRFPAIINFYAGAGGRDAEDWTTMLLRMYQRFAEKNKWEAILFHEHQNEDGGIKNASMEIKGKYAFGYLKKESGVHRLVRISPFSAKKLRHTSFALVEVLPYIEKEEYRPNIKDSDLKIELFKSSGPGGQNVNKRETAVRLIHIPTGLSASCQSERNQAANREKALNLLTSKIAHLLETEKTEEIAALKKEKLKPEWGSQIRSYVLHPYKMVKDHRTNVETSKVENVLDGHLDEFIEANLKD